MNENKRSHLVMIQNIINRLSQNSFLLKGWSVVLVSGLFALAAKESKNLFIYLAYFPALAFWLLDGYFLWQERLFRELYNYVLKLDDTKIDFSMNTSIVKEKARSWKRATFSLTLFVFHGAVIIAISLVIFFLGKGK